MTILYQHVPHFENFMLGAEGSADSFHSVRQLYVVISKGSRASVLFEW